MEWEKLLNPLRTRELLGGSASLRASADTRPEFNRDYDRAIFSTAVRRLQDKAQVFPLERNDFIRTRLTHSLEVSTVARGLASTVTDELVAKKHVSVEQAEGIRVIAMTCGLIHDLGNPPFGHAGEEAMREWFRRTLDDESGLLSALGGPNSQQTKDFLKFEGNAQTIRIVSRLQMLADHYGLNLTCGTLSAASKYVAKSNEVSASQHEMTKPGFFASENEVVEKVRSETGTGSARNPIAYLVEASDDIVYSVVDLEDGIKKRVLDWRAIRDESVLRPLVEKAEQFVEKGKLNLRGHAFEEAASQFLRTLIIAEHVYAARQAFVSRYEQIMAGEYHGELMKDSSSWPILDVCKRLGRMHVYPSQETLRLELMGRMVIQDLMNCFWEGAKEAPYTADARGFAVKSYLLLSDSYRVLFERATPVGLPLQYKRLQLVADYVAGMTDSFACSLHEKLKNG